jgi:hypothetical protein
MGLFEKALAVQLEPAEVEVVTRSIEGDGGHQRFLRELLERLDGTGGITLEDDQLRKAARYAYTYGAGGYQDRFKAFLAAARRAGWSHV